MRRLAPPAWFFAWPLTLSVSVLLLLSLSLSGVACLPLAGADTSGVPDGGVPDGGGDGEPVVCGDGIVGGDEVCDTATTCADIFGPGAAGSLVCSDQCDDVDTSDCEPSHTGACTAGGICSETRFATVEFTEQGCTAGGGTFDSDGHCDTAMATGACTVTFDFGERPDENVVYYYDGTGEALCSDVRGVWVEL